MLDLLRNWKRNYSDEGECGQELPDVLVSVEGGGPKICCSL
jgi:hypothetical protein